MYTVVFADDEVELRQAILQRIDWEGLGFSVVADAENGVEALEAVEQHEPDLLITDIRMPLMTGIELARSAPRRRSFSSAGMTISAMRRRRSAIMSSAIC